MSASSTVFESADLTASSTPGTCTLEPTPVTAPLEGPREVFFIGDIPVVVRLELNLTIEGEVTTSTALTASASESYTATAGVTYAGGQITHFGHAKPTTGYKPLDPAKASGTVSMAEGPELTVQLYGYDGPVFNDDAGLELEVDPASTPWWNLYALVYAGAEMTIPLVDKTIGDRHAFDYKFLLDHALVPSPSSPPIASGSADANVVQAEPGGNAGPVLGPDGRVWFVGSDGDQTALVALTSSTGAAQDYPLPATAKGATPVTYDDELAFDGNGDVWLVATPTQGDSAGLLLRYTPATDRSKQFALPANCAPAAPNWTGLTAATDGAVWLQCTSGGGTTALVRISPDGTQTPAKLPTGLTTIGGTPAPGPGGTAWMEAGEPGSGDAGLGEFTPAGTFTYLPASDLATYSAGQPVYLAGNAAGQVVEMTSCAGMAGAATRYCFYDIAADGAAKKYATITDISPAFGAYSSQFSLDAQGDAWIILASATSSQQVLYEVTQTGSVSQLVLTLSGDAASGGAFGPQFQPVRAADGTVWSIVSYEGGLVGLAGIKTR